MSSSDTDSAPGWFDDLARNRDVEGCIVCEKPTKSHVLLLAYDVEADELRAAESQENAVAIGHVCHDDYTRLDGDAESMVAEYEEELRALCAEWDVTLRELVEEPEKAAEKVANAENPEGEPDDDRDTPGVGGDEDGEDAADVAPDQPEVAEYVREALPEYILEAESPKMQLLHYEEKYLNVEFPTRECPECGEETEHRVETDSYRDTERSECFECGHQEKTGFEEDDGDGGRDE